jgi:hypothetical protein
MLPQSYLRNKKVIVFISSSYFNLLFPSTWEREREREREKERKKDKVKIIFHLIYPPQLLLTRPTGTFCCKWMFLPKNQHKALKYVQSLPPTDVFDAMDQRCSTDAKSFNGYKNKNENIDHSMM